MTLLVNGILLVELTETTPYDIFYLKKTVPYLFHGMIRVVLGVESIQPFNIGCSLPQARFSLKREAFIPTNEVPKYKVVLSMRSELVVRITDKIKKASASVLSYQHDIRVSFEKRIRAC
jgi:hypothetical protein